MQTTANRTVANSLPKNEVILLTLLISKRYIPYTDLRKIMERLTIRPDYFMNYPYRLVKYSQMNRYIP